MPSYHYAALKAGGEKVQGTLNAASRPEAFRLLEQQRLQPITVTLSNSGTTPDKTAPVTSSNVAPATKAGAPRVGLRLSNKLIVQFTDELSDLLEAGLQLEPALRVMESRRELSGLKEVVAVLRQRVRDGSSLSAALHATSPSFNELYCKLVASGEISGALGQILRRQAVFLTDMAELRQRVISALIYPALLVVVGIVLMGVFMTVLVPQLTMLFSKTGGTLPLATKVLIATSSFVGQWWWAMLLVLGSSATGFWAFTRQSPGRDWWHRQVLTLPLVGQVIASRYYVQFTQTVSTMITNGVPLLNALRLMHGATGNLYLRSLLGQVVELVSDGGRLSRALQRVGHFPPLLIDMVAIGEQTGDLGAALEKAGRRYDKELNVNIARLTALVQPAIIVVMALVVGLVAYSMITGIFQAIGGLRAR